MFTGFVYELCLLDIKSGAAEENLIWGGRKEKYINNKSSLWNFNNIIFSVPLCLMLEVFSYGAASVSRKCVFSGKNSVFSGKNSVF